MLVMLSVLLAAAPLGTPAAREARERHPVCAVVEIGSDQAPRAGHSFRATQILDLGFETFVFAQKKL